jgi:hypothetical protein
MKKSIVLLVASVALLSCKQAKKSTPTTVDIETVNAVRNYIYADATGKHLIIQNGLPKGEKYTAPNGMEYFKVIFWTRISNETDSNLELNIDFPATPYELPPQSGKHIKVLVPPDTMTLDQEPLYNYGLTHLTSFLDSNINAPSSLKRTIHPKESTGFFVILISQKTEITLGGTLRTGLSLKDQDLFYKISRYESSPAHSLIDEKEINCGHINLHLKKQNK